MKKFGLAIAFGSALFLFPKMSAAQEISFGVFYNSLSPYGEWVSAGDFGMCWRPVNVPYGWRPYTFGHWVWTEYGWTWVSYDPWGWAVFHYGRWYFDPTYGWVWVPGYVWAPAWVEWRWGGGYCGWAPMPPGFHFRVDVVVTGRDDDFGVRAGGWNFVRARDIGETRYSFVQEREVPRVIGTTRNVTEFKFTPRGVYNVGLQRQEVERVTRQRIQTVNIVRENNAGRERVVGNQFRIYSPAPIKPQMRNEQEAVQRERSVQRTPRPQATPRPEPRTRPEYSRPSPRVERNAPAVRPQEQPRGRERVQAKPATKEKAPPEKAPEKGRQRNHGPGRIR